MSAREVLFHSTDGAQVPPAMCPQYEWDSPTGVAFKEAFDAAPTLRISEETLGYGDFPDGPTITLKTYTDPVTGDQRHGLAWTNKTTAFLDDYDDLAPATTAYLGYAVLHWPFRTTDVGEAEYESSRAVHDAVYEPQEHAEDSYAWSETHAPWVVKLRETTVPQTFTLMTSAQGRQGRSAAEWAQILRNLAFVGDPYNPLTPAGLSMVSEGAISNWRLNDAVAPAHTAFSQLYNRYKRASAHEEPVETIWADLLVAADALADALDQGPKSA